ncbi:MAG: glycosyltransferase family 2 protein [Candidatus Omnitrophica bacterium]|nr:glycosyltransferase family 2 protein [Candidatus Omnitrophota bacterium]
MLSVIIPHYNEKTLVAESLRRVMAVPVEKEVILVDDGSSEDARQYLRQEIDGKYKNLKVIYHERNLGKGSAIRTALPHAAGDILIIQDADLEYDPNDYLKILRFFENPAIDVVYGSRYKDLNPWTFIQHWFKNRFLGGHEEVVYLHHFLGVLLLNGLANRLYSANITDEATCYKAFRRKVLEKFRLRCRGFEFCPEFTAKVRKAGYAIQEVAITYTPRTHEQGKKINWRHGLEAVCTLIKYRFVD